MDSYRTSSFSPYRKVKQEEAHTKDNSQRACWLRRGGSIFNRVMAIAAGSPSTRSLVQLMRQELDKAVTKAPQASAVEPYQALECPSCEGFMHKPICLPCGHSMCLSCVEKPSEQRKKTVTCCSCKKSHPKIPVGFTSPRHPTLLLQNLSTKWYPSLLESCAHREEGNRMAHEQNLSQALLHYTKALENGIPDHRVYSNRSKVHLDEGSLEQALKDAEMCCCIRPFWPKGHYRRGMVLEHMPDQLLDALSSYLLCLHFGGGDLPVLGRTYKVIEKLLQQSSALEKQHIVVSVVEVSKKQFEQFLFLHDKYTKDHPQLGQIDKSLMDVSEFECVLCTSILFNPVTVPCGHSFCQACLARTFDHTPYCPVCRSPLGEAFHQHTVSSGKICVDAVEDSFIKLCFPEEYQAKKDLIESDLLKRSRVGLTDSEEIPIFVCTLAYPGIPCPLHIFEPRYRLMMRRCIETNSRRFGMCLPVDDQTYSDVGTVLFISSLEYTPDGRSLVTTVGERRFQVLERHSFDGYAVARIQFISDITVEDEKEIAQLHCLQELVYAHALKWFNALPIFTRMMIMQNACTPPPSLDPKPESCPNGPTWVWWFVNAVPMSPQRKVAFLSSTSLREKLLMLKESLPLPVITSKN